MAALPDGPDSPGLLKFPERGYKHFAMECSSIYYISRMISRQVNLYCSVLNYHSTQHWITSRLVIFLTPVLRAINKLGSDQGAVKCCLFFISDKDADDFGIFFRSYSGKNGIVICSIPKRSVET